jgi:hypothetical protein
VFERLAAEDTEDEVTAAWVAVDLLRRVYQAPDRDTAHRRLVVFYEWAVTVDVDEITRLARTIDTWQEKVLAFFDTRASNAPTESANVKTTSIRRAARGFNNCDNYWARILLHAGQRRRLPTTTRIRSYGLTIACWPPVTREGTFETLGPQRRLSARSTGSVTPTSHSRGSPSSPTPQRPHLLPRDPTARTHAEPLGSTDRRLASLTRHQRPRGGQRASETRQARRLRHHQLDPLAPPRPALRRPPRELPKSPQSSCWTPTSTPPLKRRYATTLLQVRSPGLDPRGCRSQQRTAAGACTPGRPKGTSWDGKIVDPVSR